MGFTVAGQFALDAAKPFQILEGHAVETVIGAQGINPILAVPGVVDEIVGFMPGTVFDREHDAVDGRDDLGKSRRAAPMRSRAAVDGAHVHEGDQSAAGARITQDDLLALRIFHLDGKLRGLRGRRSQL